MITQVLQMSLDFFSIIHKIFNNASNKCFTITSHYITLQYNYNTITLPLHYHYINAFLQGGGGTVYNTTAVIVQ